MGLLRARVSGAWVDTDQVGSARVSGSWVDFGPSGPSTEVVNWINPPTLTNGDDSTTYNMGCAFTVTHDTECFGVEWRVPDTLTAPSGGVYTASLWAVSPNILRRTKTFTPVAGSTQRILFDSSYILNTSEGSGYIVSVVTRSYSFRSAPGQFPFLSPSSNVSVSIGKLSETSDVNTIPGSNFESIFYISPVTSV